MRQTKFFLKVIIGLVILVVPLVTISLTTDIQEGDLVRTANNPALYLIQNGKKRVFPHAGVYYSWGLPRDFSTVKVVSDLSDYPEADPVPFRDGSLFRGSTKSLYGREASAVFFVSDGKLRPIKSGKIYQELFKDPKWQKVIQVPDDLLDKFAYPMGEAVDSSKTHPDGTLVRYNGSLGIYLIEAGKKRPIKSIETFNKNRLDLNDVIEIESTEAYPNGSAIQPEEEKLTMNIPDTVKNTTFVKAYRFYNNNKGFGVWPTKNNNYIFAGEFTIGFQTFAFINKINQQGKLIWHKFITGNKPTYDTGFLATQLKDNSYLLAGQSFGCTTDEEAELVEDATDIFLSKIDQKGNLLWTETVGDLAQDTPAALYPTNDGGFLLYGTLAELGAGAEYVGDEDHYFFLAKFDSNGKKEWIKKTNFNIGGTMGTAQQVNFTIEKNTDGSFVLIGVIPGNEISKKENEAIVTNMPVVVKIDKNGNVIWAKTLEAIPTKLLIPKLNGEGGYTEDYVDYRISAGNFSAVQKTPDDGYLVIGLYSPFINQGTGLTNLSYVDNPLVGVKFDKDGNYQWTKKIKTDLLSYDYDFKVTKTKDNDFIIMQNYMAKGGHQGEEYDNFMNKSEIVYKLCPDDYKPGDEENNPALKKAMEERAKAKNEMEATGTNHIVLTKIDPDFNVKWIKTIGPKVKAIPVSMGATNGVPYQFIGNDIRVDNDGGIVIAGNHGTDVVCFVSFGVKFFCQDALLIKLDKNGNLADDSSDLVKNYTTVSQQDLSQYITIRDVQPKIIDYELWIKKQKANIPTSKIKAITTLSPFKKKTIILREQEPISSLATPQTAPQAKTWEEINYDNTETVELENNKSREVHNELLPILNQLFNNKVKLRDNFGGISLDYTFDRLVTRDDVEAVQEYLEGIGYTTNTSEGGQLIMMKIGRTLNIVFSIESKRHGTMEATF